LDRFINWQSKYLYNKTKIDEEIFDIYTVDCNMVSEKWFANQLLQFTNHWQMDIQAYQDEGTGLQDRK